MHRENVLANVSQLKKYFPIKEGIIFDRMIGNVRAVDDVSFEIYRGETLGLGGESGSGKTTVGRSLLRIIEPTSGRIEFDGRDIVGMNRKEFREIQHRMQMIFKLEQILLLVPLWENRVILLCCYITMIQAVHYQRPL